MGPQQWRCLFALAVCARAGIALGGDDDLADLSVDDEWTPSALQQALHAATHKQDPWTGTTKDALQQAERFAAEDDSTFTEFRDALKNARASAAEQQDKLSVTEEGADQREEFRDLQALARKEQLEHKRWQVKKLKRQLGEALNQGEHLASLMAGHGPPPINTIVPLPNSSDWSAEDRQRYVDGYHVENFGAPAEPSPELEPGVGVEPVQLSYFDQLHKAQYKERIQKALVPDDVLPYASAGLFCTDLIDNGRIKENACTASSPIRCDLAFQLCEVRTVENGQGTWRQVEPEANCLFDHDCEREKLARVQAILKHRKDRAFKKAKKEFEQEAQDKMEARDQKRREISAQADAQAEAGKKKYEAEIEQDIEAAGVDGQAPLPTAKLMAAKRAIKEKMFTEKKQILDQDKKFSNLATLSRNCTQLHKACEAKCPPLIELTLETDNACTLDCKQKTGRCVEHVIDKRYKGVQATVKAIKAALKLRKKAKPQAQVLEVGENNVFKVASSKLGIIENI